MNTINISDLTTSFHEMKHEKQIGLVAPLLANVEDSSNDLIELNSETN